MPRPRHQKKEVEKVLEAGEATGWVVTATASGHRWGVARCPMGCQVAIYSTPKNPGNHAKRIAREFDRCPHLGSGEE